MTKKLFSIILTIFCATFIGIGALNAPSAFAADDVCSQSGVPESVQEAAGCNGTNSKDFQNTVINIINGIIAVLGVVAVVFIVIGGINYMISQGDSGKIKKARDTILYAAIGLIICALAYAIVNFVIANVIGQN